MRERNPVLKQIRDISHREDFKDFYKSYLSDIHIGKYAEILAKYETDIKAFHSMVVNIDTTSKCAKSKEKTDLFKQLSKKMIADGYDAYSGRKCEKQFEKWTEFYAQVLND